MKNIFTEHPNSIGESYLQHMKFAMTMGLHMIAGGVAFIFHAVFPFFFQKTGSDYLFKMIYSFIERMPQANEPRVIKLSHIIEKKLTSPTLKHTNE